MSAFAGSPPITFFKRLPPYVSRNLTPSFYCVEVTESAGTRDAERSRELANARYLEWLSAVFPVFSIGIVRARFTTEGLARANATIGRENCNEVFP